MDFEVVICVKKILPPSFLELKLPQYGPLMKGTWITSIHINEQIVMIKNHDIICDWIFFMPYVET
jgi:hypothetical protein